jgi:diaminohydroxyphosphoribosylaminopyrimidine deaminase/5-amino-6-(5-phosphoribosylamino)uracil reductase
MVPVWLVCSADEEHPNTDALRIAAPRSFRFRSITAFLPFTTRSRRFRAGITRVLVEGGPSVARAFIDADLVDEAVIYQGPKRVGESGLLPFVGDGLDRLSASGHFIEIETRSFGRDQMHWWRRVGRCSPALSAA